MLCGTPPCLPTPLPAYTMEPAMPPYTVKDPATPHFMRKLTLVMMTATNLAMMNTIHAHSFIYLNIPTKSLICLSPAAATPSRSVPSWPSQPVVRCHPPSGSITLFRPLARLPCEVSLHPQADNALPPLAVQDGGAQGPGEGRHQRQGVQVVWVHDAPTCQVGPTH